MKKISLLALVVVIIFSIFVMDANAQAGDEISISFSRDFGYASGTGKIQGLFSIKVSSERDLVSVDFYIDENSIGKDDSEPFKLQFNTDNYPEGKRSIYVIGTTVEGEIIRSRNVNVTFLSAEDSRSAIVKLVVPILGISLLVAVLAGIGPALIRKKKGFNLPSGSQRNYGAAGGSICRNCNRPFARHVLAPNMLVGKLEICPNCGKWGIYKSLSLDVLRAAEEEELEKSDISGGMVVKKFSEEDKLKKMLEDSRFDDQ